MLKLNYFLADIFILSAEKQPIKLSWRKIEWLRVVYTGRVSYEVVMPLWNRNMIDFILNDFMITNLILKHFNKRMNYD